jgi:hypothetical protein
MRSALALDEREVGGLVLTRFAGIFGRVARGRGEGWTFVRCASAELRPGLPSLTRRVGVGCVRAAV